MIKIFLKLLIASIIIFNFGSSFLVGNINIQALCNDKSDPACTQSTQPCNDKTDPNCAKSANPCNDKTDPNCIKSTKPCNDKTDPACAKQSDGPVIGGLKNCTVDKNATFTPKDGNEKLKNCLRDIIQLVITIAVLISVASLAGYGIQLMNPMETSGKIQGQIAQRITELAVGGIILGMFGTILATINPATLTTSKVFGDNAVATFREFIKAGQGTTNSGVSKGTGAAPGAGGTSSGGSSDPALKAIYVDNKQTIDPTKLAKVAANKSSSEYKALQKLVDLNDQCTDIFATGTECVSYSKIDDKIIKELKDAGIKSSYADNSTLTDLPGPVIANYDMKVTKESDDTSGIYTATFQLNGKTETQKFNIKGTAGQLCPVSKLFLGDPVKAGTKIIDTGCSIKTI
jgi:hypothetical protein